MCRFTERAISVRTTAIRGEERRIPEDRCWEVERGKKGDYSLEGERDARSTEEDRAR